MIDYIEFIIGLIIGLYVGNKWKIKTPPRKPTKIIEDEEKN